jgi:formiminotetrahydrofolate cyclodeaminase
LKEKALLRMPISISRKKKKTEKQKGPKHRKEERTKKKKQINHMERQDTQAHGKVPQSGDVAQSVVTLAQGSFNAKRKMFKLSTKEASVLV